MSGLVSAIKARGIQTTAAVLRRGAIVDLLRAATRGVSLALCCHRVAYRRRPTDVSPAMTIEEPKLDWLLETLSEALDDGPAPRLTVTFDDGYADALRYLADRVALFPRVEWIYFLCPKKTEGRVGFRWDAHERGGGRSADLDRVLDDDLDRARENARADLRAAAADPLFALASIADIRALAATGVALGLHTNTHFRFTALSDADVDAELDESGADFARLFGAVRHFAYPFGTPGPQIAPHHVALFHRRFPDALQWSTERRPFRDDERRAEVLIPRFPVDGTRSGAELAVWIAAECAQTRALDLVRGRRHRA